MSVYEEMGIPPVEPKSISKELLYNLARTYTILSKLLAQYFAEFGLSPAKFNVLMALKQAGKEKGLPQNEIGDKMIVSGSNITGIVDRLEKDELVTRDSDPKDRRVNLVRVTKKGLGLLERVWTTYSQKIEDLTGTLSEKDKRELIRLLTKWRRGIAK